MWPVDVWNGAESRLTLPIVLQEKNGPTKIEMTSDADGHFTGPLPKPGAWRVDILGDEPRLRTSARVEVKPKGDRASVVIDLLDTKIYGRVVTALDLRLP